MTDYANSRQRPAWEIVDIVAIEYSVHPRLLLTLPEAGSGALTRPEAAGEDLISPLGFRSDRYRGLYRQLLWAAESLNRGYYGWRMGTLTELELSDGRLVRPDPWLNAGTAALHVLLAERFGQAASTCRPGRKASSRPTASCGRSIRAPGHFIPGNLAGGDQHVPELRWISTGGPRHVGRLPMGALDSHRRLRREAAPSPGNGSPHRRPASSRAATKHS
jgi:hypothetical protein